MSQNLEMADPFNMGDTIINNHFTLVHAHLCSCNKCKTVHTLHDVAFGCYLTLVLASL